MGADSTKISVGMVREPRDDGGQRGPQQRVRAGGAVFSRPRPRALLLAVDAGYARNLESIFPTLDVRRSLDEVEQVDYDVLITWAGVPEDASDDLFVLAIDHWAAADQELRLGDVISKEHFRASATYGPGSLTREFTRPDLPTDLADLVEHVLQPGVESARSHRVVRFTTTYGGYFRSISASALLCTPFLSGIDGSIIACSFMRSTDSECWALPRFVTDIAPWAQAAVRHWRTIAPGRFPGEAIWTHHKRWATMDERALLAELDSATEEFESQKNQFEERSRRILGNLAEQRSIGDRMQRALLTEQGDALVAAIASTLQHLGFSVEIVDNSGRSAKVEDLRVTDPDVHGWQALVEVKGYVRGGARAGDLLQIGKFQSLFAVEKGRLPDRSWYVVNHSLNEDPNLRREVLLGAEPEIRVFADTGGLVIDTRALFDIRADVDAGLWSAADARARLRTETGRFQYSRLS